MNVMGLFYKKIQNAMNPGYSIRTRVIICLTENSLHIDVNVGKNYENDSSKTTSRPTCRSTLNDK